MFVLGIDPGLTRCGYGVVSRTGRRLRAEAAGVIRTSPEVLPRLSVVLARAEAAEKAGLKPKFRILGYAHAGVRPEVMGIGPVPAVEMLLKRTGLSAEDFDVIESNEAFAAQALAVNKELGLDPAKVNPNGGAIALGHPVGATGVRILTTMLREMERREARYGLETMCIGGGQGLAAVFERVS
mgnify:CR=1 FL=1